MYILFTLMPIILYIHIIYVHTVYKDSLLIPGAKTRFWFLKIIPHSKDTIFSEEMANSGAGARKIQSEPRKFSCL